MFSSARRHVLQQAKMLTCRAWYEQVPNVLLGHYSALVRFIPAHVFLAGAKLHEAETGRASGAPMCWQRCG